MSPCLLGIKYLADLEGPICALCLRISYDSLARFKSDLDLSLSTGSYVCTLWLSV